MKKNEIKTIDSDIDYESPNGVDNCTAIIDDLHDALYNEYIDDPCLLLHLHYLNVYQIDYPESSLCHPDVFKAARKAFTPTQVIALYHYSNFDAKRSRCPIDRKTKIFNALKWSESLLEYKITDVLEFQEKIRWMPPVLFQDFTDILYGSGIMRYMCPEDNDRLNPFERKIDYALKIGYQEGRIVMHSHSYTVLACTNPELISSRSNFVKESVSQLLKTHNYQSHFFTNGNTMDEELVGLSARYPDEIFTASQHIITDFGEIFVYYFDYTNGICKEVARKPGYKFHCVEERIPESKEYSYFRDYVMERLNGVDVGKLEDEGFRLDSLINVNDRNGYKSYDSIIYEGDQCKWIAEEIRFSYVSVLVETKEAGIGNPLEQED